MAIRAADGARKNSKTLHHVLEVEAGPSNSKKSELKMYLWWLCPASLLADSSMQKDASEPGACSLVLQLTPIQLSGKASFLPLPRQPDFPGIQIIL